MSNKAKAREPFRLQGCRAPAPDKTPTVRIKTGYYILLKQLKAMTGLSPGAIIAQCIDYALENAEAEILSAAVIGTEDQ